MEKGNGISFISKLSAMGWAIRCLNSYVPDQGLIALPLFSDDANGEVHITALFADGIRAVRLRIFADQTLDWCSIVDFDARCMTDPRQVRTLLNNGEWLASHFMGMAEYNLGPRPRATIVAFPGLKS